MVTTVRPTDSADRTGPHDGYKVRAAEVSSMLLLMMMLQSVVVGETHSGPGERVALTILSDESVVVAGDLVHLLIEVRNISSSPLVLPSTRTLPPYFGLRRHFGDGRWTAYNENWAHLRRSARVLPPGLALHSDFEMHVPVDHRGALAVEAVLWAPEGWLAQLIELDRRGPDPDVRSQGASGSNSTGNPLVGEEFVGSVVSPQFVLTVDPPGASPGRWELDSAGRALLGSVSRRYSSAKRLDELLSDRPDSGYGDLRDVEIDELKSKDLSVDAREIETFASSASGPYADDVWFAFASSPVWSDDAPTRQRLLAELSSRYPASTGARKAAVAMEWDELGNYLERSRRLW